ncbi:MAG: Peptidase M23 [Candidatus Gottesmanbacteria bacterium GW2011_GWA1_43_11]|uniref:Peptidase M23 n=1 Tax=Candidatus Gottesmanbacteria bacterium GW2011_GWA1_43_11 TaxID=1618436 RepID=A0A0G1CH78_9BACT|nr:MAG: Peptidase M23 [Candidatus Gottesmanbacteria bacterium GW2011_GWA1_43_11]
MAIINRKKIQLATLGVLCGAFILGLGSWLEYHSVKQPSSPQVFEGEREFRAPREKIVSYMVKEGDTPFSIAETFDISVDSVKWANNLTSDVILPGQNLQILPVTGIAHKVVNGDSVEDLALKYHTTPQKIIDYPFNKFADLETHSLVEGEVLIIPGGSI